MTYSGKTKCLKAAAAVMAVVVAAVSIGIGGNVMAARDSVTDFEANFSGLKNGIVATDDADTVAALEDKFYIYNAQRESQTSHTSYFERNEVNGYIVVDSTGVDKPKFPDTGVSPAWNLDGYGTAKDKAIPTWSLKDGWLSCSTYGGEDAFLFRQGNLLYVKESGSVSGFAAVKNFQLETSFKFSSTDENDALAVIFHAKDAGLAAHPYQDMIAFNADGKLVISKVLGESLNFQSPIAYNDVLKAKDGSDIKFEKDHAYSLTLTVIGRTMTLTIKDGKTEVCSYETNELMVTGYEDGYLALGVSNNGPAIADVRVRRLDDNGGAVNFTDPVPGYEFGFTGTTLCDYRTYYYADIGGGPQLIEGNYYSRDLNRDLYWYDFWSSVRHGDPTWVGYGMNEVDDKLTSMFATYHEQISVSTHQRLFAKSNKYSDRIGAELWLGDGQTSAQGYMHNGNRLLLLGDPLEHKLLSQIMTIAPRIESGDQVITKNVETSFGAILFNDPEKAIAFSFRSGSAGAMINDDATGGYADKVTVVLSGAGYKVFDGEGVAVSGNSLNSWNDGSVFNGENANVYIKAVGDKLILKVTNDAGKVYLDTSSEPITLSTAHNGYCYFSSLDGYGYFPYLGFARLDDKGERADLNTNPTIEIVSADYTTVTATIDRAQGQSLGDVGLPTELVGTTADGLNFNVPVRWDSDDYRSYKDGTFDFVAVSTLDNVKFADSVKLTAKITNKINGDFDTATTRKYYFDSENDFKDFICHLTDVTVPATGTTAPIKMKTVDALKYWTIENGRAKANYSRNFVGGWQGLNRANDASSMVLADNDMALINFQLDIDYTHGTEMYPYILTNVQDSNQFFADLYIERASLDTTNGNGTGLSVTDETKKGGVWQYIDGGEFHLWGAVESNGSDHVYFLDGITEEGQNFRETYDRSKQHHMTIRVVNGMLSVKVDNSDVYYAVIDESALGGFIGFAACGNYVTYDNLTITALDANGAVTSLATAEKGFGQTFSDDYTGWQPNSSDWSFDWKSPYID